ncbi:MAG: D-2-hydroxyacid dehydrogenase [Pseudomonadota bacterium]
MKKTELLILLPHEKMRSKLQQLIAPRFPDVTLHMAGDKAEALSVIGSADVIVTFGSMLASPLLANAHELKWVHSLGTGVDGICDNPELADGVAVTATRGIHGPVMAEMAFCMMLALSRDLPRNIRSQAAHKWDRWPAALLFNKKIGIIGVGAIAQDIALRCRAFGMHVTGVSRTPRELPNFDRMVGHDGMLEAVRDFDYVVLTIPYAPESHHMVDAAFLSNMKASSYLVNIARGGVVDEDALLEALKARRIAGAGLDVFAAEPLGPESPFWDLDNVIITAHQGGFSNTYIADAFPCLEHHLAAFCQSGVSGMDSLIAH